MNLKNEECKGIYDTKHGLDPLTIPNWILRISVVSHLQALTYLFTFYKTGNGVMHSVLISLQSQSVFPHFTAEKKVVR